MQVGDVIHPELARYGKPLDGVRILSLEQQQALPFATQLMARLGADVVKVENPERGDSGRAALPGMRDPEGRFVGAAFLRNNFDKRSLALDLKAPEGQDILRRLIPRFDVVAENFRAGTMARLGFGYDDVAAIHPTVVYVSVSGFGNLVPTPYADWAAYASIAEAMSSLYDFKRDPEVPPVTSPMGALGDTGTALFATIGILAALRHRDRTGEGQYVDIAMYDSMVAMADAGINYWSLGLTDPRNAKLINHAFRASDGFFVIQCSARHHFVALAGVVGCTEWADDPGLAGPAEWFAHIDDVIRPGVERWAKTRTRHEACDALAAAGIATGPCHSPADVIRDPHVLARNMIIEMPRPDGVEQPVLNPGNPVKLSKMAEGPDRRVPWLGEHTDEVLATELGLDAAECARLREAGVVG
jgi:crotonobetainyl-CoA:carnitine CoA-transferase CaiB-like acyl-CoA transferase